MIASRVLFSRFHEKIVSDLHPYVSQIISNPDELS